MMLPSLPSQSKRVSSLEFLALKESVKLVLLGAETGQEAFMHVSQCVTLTLVTLLGRRSKQTNLFKPEL